MSQTSIESPQTTARLAGALWLVVIIVSVLEVVTGPSPNLTGSPAEAAASVLASETGLRLVYAANFFGGLCYLGVTALLYEVFRPANRSLALFAALAGAAGLAVGSAGGINEIAGFGLLHDAARATPADANQMQTIAQVFMRDGPEFSVAMVYFGCQVAAIGVLILRSRFVPRVIGALMVAGGSSYIITSFAKFIAPGLGAQLSPFVIPIAFLGEGTITLWLLFKGVTSRNDQLQTERGRSVVNDN